MTGRAGGRGLGRGRGRGMDDKSKTPAPRQAGHSQPAPPPQQSAWGRKPGAVPPPQQQQQQQPQPQPQAGPSAQQRAPAAESRSTPRVGRGDLAQQEGAGDVGAAGDPGAALGRGSMRGRRVIVPEIHTRPSTLITKKGTTGNPIPLQANYFKLLAQTDWCLYQYRVDFAPEEDRTVVRKGMLRQHKEALGAYVFDGTVMYTSRRLGDELEFWSQRQSDDEKIRISIRLVGDLKKGDHQYIQFFNIIVRKCLELLNLQIVGRDYYDARAKVEIRDFRLELWPGYLTSIRQHESSMLMCAEITHKVMRQQTVLDILTECYENNQRNYKSAFESQVIGLVVLTDYNNNTYRISDVDFDANPSSTFQLRNGESISYKDYYNNKYRIKIQGDSQPMLVSKVKAKDRRAGQPEIIYLVPELCRATGMTDRMRENFQLMRALSEHTRVSPQARIDKLLSFNNRLRSQPGIVQELNEWNLKLDSHLVNVPGRVLPPEKIILGGGRSASAGQFADWTRELQSKPAYNAARLNNWVLICVNRMRRDVERFVTTLQECAKGMGCAFDKPRIFEIGDDRSNTYTESLEKVMSSTNPELVFCVVPNNRADRYGAIKKKCVVDRPVPSQVFLYKNVTSKNVRSIATKVAIQVNCKLGGGPWSVDLPPINLMVVGFDVCHDPSDRSRDFGAMVASLDKGLTRYFSAVSHHSSGEELSNQFSTNLVTAIQDYKKLNKILPSHILIYRDGVGEGQVPYVFEHEVTMIKSRLHSLYGEAPVKMGFVIVTKRINTRVFHGDKNPPPGTVIDDVVTNPLRYDFFIIPQSVRQGTVTPCAFNVIDDTLGWKADQLQRMTYKLCHMYFNWSGTVRVPAPCQYAHKLAFLVAQFIRRLPSTQMANLLYFL
ncbi:piwi-like protein Siwi isoform X2 [Ceratina calcarata]|uniref:Piwi-like protein Siwi isoform X2 n=1 Tax=Ceratina calcarata TaxID=156304 RepID=A0AAJ7S6K7_9HYME|nr:piwi-like protein Siwi isoform X2 [Ceratina calcarata]